MAAGITCQFAKSRLALPVVFSAAVVTGHLHLRIAGFAICSETGIGEVGTRRVNKDRSTNRDPAPRGFAYYPSRAPGFRRWVPPLSTLAKF